MEEDVKCITDIKPEPPDEENVEDPIAPRTSDAAEDTLALRLSDSAEDPLATDVAEDPLAPRPSDYRFIEHYNKTKQSDIKVEQTEVLKREDDLSGVANDDCALLDHNLGSNGDSELASLSLNEGCVDVSEEDTSRSSRGRKQYACIIYSEAEYLETDKKYFCCYCDFRSANIVLVHKHRTSVHKDIVPFTCTQCGYRAKKASNLNSHVTNKHRRKRLFKCKHLNCDFTSGDLSDVEKHLTDVHNSNAYACDKCEFTTAYENGLKRHLSVIHGKVTIQTCDQCDYKSKILHHMKRHISAVHENRKPFTCTLCNYRSKRLTQLRRHISSHHNAVCLKPSICTS